MAEGLSAGEVALRPWTPDWGEEFAGAHAEMIRAGLPEIQVAHIGSTAVPHMRAKPIIDIAIGYNQDCTLPNLIAILPSLGYVYRGWREEAGGDIFTYSAGDRITRHVHAVPYRKRDWQRYVIHREYLRACESARSRYEALKVLLAARYPHDRRLYTSAKKDLLDILYEEGLRSFGVAAAPP